MPDEEGQTLWSHVGVLRNYVLAGGGIFILAAIVTFPYGNFFTSFLTGPLNGEILIFLSPLDPLLFKIRISLYIAFFIAFPFWLILGYSFVAPALPTHKRTILGLFSAFSLMLGAGALVLTYKYFVPLTLLALKSFAIPETELALTADSYLSFFLLELSVMFFISQLPVIIVGLAYVGLINPHTLARQRRFLILGIVAVLAVLTPTTDVITLGIVSILAIVLLEVGITLAKVFVKKS